MEKRKWYAVYTRSRAEKKVTEFMNNEGYIAYLPLIKTLRQWSDRKKMVEMPLISSYVFVNVSLREYYKVLDIPGVVCYVTFEGKAAPIRDIEIEAMKIAVDGNMKIELENETIKAGQKVKVISGPMKGAEGEYIESRHKSNFIINLNHIGFLLKIEISASDVIKL